MNGVAAQALRPLAGLFHGQPTSDGGGVNLTRVIGTPQLRERDPFLLLDELRSDRPQDYVAGFPEHPHRGFETLTYLIAGRLRHRDNHGHAGEVGSGGAQWMRAGRGIVHSEMPLQEQGLLWGFQIWINLPARERLGEPAYLDVQGEDIPQVEPASGVRARVVAGDLFGASGPVRNAFVALRVADLALGAGAAVDVPAAADDTVLVYACEGELRVADGRGGRAIPAGSLALLGRGERLGLESYVGGRGLLLMGRATGEPIARWGPFVMNTQDEIQAAIRDFREGRF
jgi:hypothetical protein